MTALHPEDPHVWLTPDDACTAQLAGCKFARTLVGADPEDYALALAEQEHLVERAIRRGSAGRVDADRRCGRRVSVGEGVNEALW